MEMPGFPTTGNRTGGVRGRPVIARTRMGVLDMLADGTSLAEIVTDFTYVTIHDIRACLRFAARTADLRST